MLIVYVLYMLNQFHYFVSQEHEMGCSVSTVFEFETSFKLTSVPSIMHVQECSGKRVVKWKKSQNGSIYLVLNFLKNPHKHETISKSPTRNF